MGAPLPDSRQRDDREVQCIVPLHSVASRAVSKGSIGIIIGRAVVLKGLLDPVYDGRGHQDQARDL